MLKVELSGTVLDEVKYNIIQCRICFNKGMEKISINFLKPELLLQLLSIAIFFGKIHPVLIKNLIFFPGFFEKKKKKKTYKTQVDIFSKFFSKRATESGLLGSKISH